jgi:hypothetical protein
MYLDEHHGAMPSLCAQQQPRDDEFWANSSNLFLESCNHQLYYESCIHDSSLHIHFNTIRFLQGNKMTYNNSLWINFIHDSCFIDGHFQ